MPRRTGARSAVSRRTELLPSAQCPAVAACIGDTLDWDGRPEPATDLRRGCVLQTIHLLDGVTEELRAEGVTDLYGLDPTMVTHFPGSPDHASGASL